MTLNQLTLAGNLVRDPELRYNQKGIGTCKFSIGITTCRTAKDGNATEDKAFVDVLTFGYTAEYIASNAKKGDNIMVSGRLKTESWEDKEQKKHSKLIVVAMDAVLVPWMGPPKDNSTQHSQPQRNPKVSPPSNTASVPPPQPASEDDVPF